MIGHPARGPALAITLLAATAGCNGALDEAPVPGAQHGPYAAPPEGAVPLGGPLPESDEDALEDVTNPAGVGRLTLVRGRELYSIHCAPCHGDSGKGDGPIAPLLSEETPDLTHPELQAEASDGALVHVIATGTMSEVMPGFAADIPVADRWVLVRYLRSIRRTAPASRSSPRSNSPADPN